MRTSASAMMAFVLVLLALAGGARGEAHAQATAPREPQQRPVMPPPGAPPPEAPAPPPASPSPGSPPPEPAPAAAAPAPEAPAAPAPAEPAAPPPAAAPAAPAPAPAGPVPPAPAAPPTPAPSTPANLEETHNPAGSWIGAGLAVGLLNMPKLGLGLEVAGEIRTPVMWPIEVGATYWFDNDDELSSVQTDLIAHPLLAVPYPPGGSAVSIQETMLSAALCPYEFEMATGSFLACGGASGGLIRASGEGFVDEKTVVRGLFEIDAYARWHFRLGGGLGITYSAGLFVPFFRDHFGYHDRFGAYHDQFRMSALGGRLDFLLSYGF